MKASRFVILDYQILQNLLHQVRKAQGKLRQTKGGAELVEEINWAIRAIEITSFEQSEQMLDSLMDEQGLTLINEKEGIEKVLNRLGLTIEWDEDPIPYDLTERE